MVRRAKEYQSAREGRMALRQGTCWVKWRLVAKESAMAVQKRMKTGQRNRNWFVTMIGRSTMCARRPAYRLKAGQHAKRRSDRFALLWVDLNGFNGGEQ